MDVVVPFRGSRSELDELRDRLARVRRRRGDSVVVVDNTPCASPPGDGAVPVVQASARRTPGYARNCGAARGDAEWLVFIDADVLPPEDLLDRYFSAPPGKATALLAGGIVDEPVPPDASAAARYTYLRGAMSQEDSLRLGRWAYPKTANAACRRAAFDAVDGFREDIRAGEDADLTYRLRAVGWTVERRDDAAVVHRNRRTAWAFAKQKVLHGAGGAWLERHYPGSFPPRGFGPGLIWWAVRTVAVRLASAVRSRERDALLWAVFDPLEVLAWELGRSIPNNRPRAGASARDWIRVVLGSGG